MRRKSWNLIVRDCVESPPFVVAGEIILAVRTPRSRDFVTVEIGLVSENPAFRPESTDQGVVCCSSPLPWISKGWCGEVFLGEDGTVVIQLDGRTFQITLRDIDDSELPPPWVSYQFLLLEEERRRAVPLGPV